jgi:hypothetical protein
MLTALRITIFISLNTKSKNQCNLNGGFYLAKLGHIYLALLMNNYLKYILPTSLNRTDLSTPYIVILLIIGAIVQNTQLQDGVL